MPVCTLEPAESTRRAEMEATYRILGRLNEKIRSLNVMKLMERVADESDEIYSGHKEFGWLCIAGHSRVEMGPAGHGYQRIDQLKTGDQVFEPLERRAVRVLAITRSWAPKLVNLLDQRLSLTPKHPMKLRREDEHWVLPEELVPHFS